MTTAVEIALTNYTDPKTIRFARFIDAFESWDYDRQTDAVEKIRNLEPSCPEFRQIAEVMASIRDERHPERASKAA